jgi:hypothetical protein
MPGRGFSFGFLFCCGIACVLLQWEEIHVKEVFIPGNAVMKSIELTLLPICFLFLKNSIPLVLASI